MTKKRLRKDLPFGKLSSGDVLTKSNDGYYVELGDTLYDGGGSSSKGQNIMEDKECEMLDLIWDNSDWFEPATIDQITMKAECSKIILSFEPLDLRQAQDLAKGIRHHLLDFGNDGNYSWSEYKGFSLILK